MQSQQDQKKTQLLEVTAQIGNAYQDLSLTATDGLANYVANDWSEAMQQSITSFLLAEIENFV